MYSFLIIAGAIASASGFMESSGSFFHNCTDSEFVCGNLECIPLSKRCDQKEDCKDKSDEMDCEMILCKPPDFFRCKNSRCLSSSFVCDGEDDCDDFSDEIDCSQFKQLLQSNTTCAKNQWRCSDNLCIPSEWVCNGENDCLDGSDEALGCSSDISCDGFKCKNNHCIPIEWRCDGLNDCNDNSDETTCDIKIDPKDCTIETQHFLCKNGKNCIKLVQACDGTPQCPDKSDEAVSCKVPCTGCSHECIQLPTGPRCICPKGYRTVDQTHCQDINECEQFGICDQKCRNLPGSYQCFCDENYSLYSDNKTCKSHFGEATMFFSTKKEIRAYKLRSEVYFSVTRNLKQVVGVDFDGKYVYWTDILAEHESIVRASLQVGSKKELLVTTGLGAPEDLHIDYITGNIYFTDAERQHIGVCTNDGRHCSVLISKGIHKPRGIVLQPHEGVMFWTDWGRRPEIARAFMDGSNDTSFVSEDIHWPNGVAIDGPNERLYWTDAKLMSLENIKLDGTDRRVVLEGVVRHPYAIAVFENKLYWSDWATHSIQACDKFTGKNHHTIIKDQKEFIYGISIYHPNNQKKVVNPCESSYCSDICLLSRSGLYRCACPQNKVLSSDRHSCNDLEKQQKLILGVDNMLLEIEHQLLGKHDVRVLSMSAKKIGALSYNSISNILYVSDLLTRKIISLDLHSRKSKPLEVNDLGQVTAMDYDYLGNNLYWCDSERKTVEVLNVNSRSRTILLHEMNEEVPEAIALIPEEGVMFVAFRKSRRESHVDRIGMDGTSRSHPVETGLIGHLTLLYDRDLERIFLADAGTGNIESISVEGDERHGFRALNTAPIGLASLKHDLFWVNKNSRKLCWADKYNSGETDYNHQLSLDIPDNGNQVHIASITPKKIGLSPCQFNNGNCSHLCLHSNKNVVCVCPIGMNLEQDGKTCTTRISCLSSDFFCAESNMCIDSRFRCDGTNNCHSGEDEKDCKNENHCLLNNFQCQNGECIKEELKCDNHYDCSDKSDEHNCTHVDTRHCPPKHFRCQSGKCIEERFVCDSVIDCPDREDEDNCVGSVCKHNEFRCLSGACIPKGWECDHDYDCLDMSDEHSGCSACSLKMFTCVNNKCIDKSFVCDKENDCGDNSDEENCDKVVETCLSGQFPCSAHTHVCLPNSARCNGTSECPHHEDEQDCSNCHVDEFTCNNKKCVPTQWICDHTDDCGDNSDEVSSLCHHEVASFAPPQPCNDGFQCKNRNCIDMSLVCNGKADCFDGSDEDGVCTTACNNLNDPCSQICVKTPTGPKCTCQEGYRLQGDGKSCLDVNECEIYPPICSQICHNKPGSYLCDCYNGFVIRNNRVACKAEGKPMSLIFTSDDEIREWSQANNSLILVHTQNLAKITGLDVSTKTNSIYFSVEDSGAIIKINQNLSTKEYLQEAGQPQKLAVDWITDNVYYVNNELSTKSINICNFNDKECAKLISVDVHRQITALAVDAVNKHLFYSLVSWWMLSAPNYVLYRTNLDGTEVVEVVKSSSGYVTGIAFDLYKKELYYVEQNVGEIHKVNYDGSNKIVLFSHLKKPAGLEFFENHLYLITTGGFIEKCKLYSSYLCHSFKINSLSNDLFAIMQQSKQPELAHNLCKNHTCSHLCVPKKSSYNCLCSDGTVVNSNELCNALNRESTGADSNKIWAIHHMESYAEPYSSPNLGGAIAGILTSAGMAGIFAAIYYIIKKRNTGGVNVSVRFQNPSYGLQVKDDFEKLTLQPGQHEYVNPMDVADTKESEKHKQLFFVSA